MKITLPFKLSPEFTGMRNKFADLIDDIARAMHDISYDELKTYACFRFHHLRPQIAECEDTISILQLISDQCQLTDVTALESVVSKFKVEQAKSAIQYYKDEIENFYQKGRPLRQFLDSQLALSSALQCKTATITVKAVNDYELKDIKILMTFLFEAIAPNVKVVVIREDNFTDSFQGMCVAGDTSFLLRSDTPHQLFNWEEYGLRITISQEVVPICSDVEVAITAFVCGNFILPEDTELVSAVYAISVSKPLLPDAYVQLEIQHCVSIKTPAHSNYLSFATASSDCSPYQFQQVKGGIFAIGNQYGNIYLSGFSLWSIIKKKFRRCGQLQSSIASISNNISTDVLIPPSPLPQSPSRTNFPTHALPSPSGNTPSVPPSDTLALPSTITLPSTYDTGSVPLSPSSNLPLSTSPLHSIIFSPSTIDVSPSSTLSSSMHTTSSTVDSLQHGTVQ